MYTATDLHTHTNTPTHPHQHTDTYTHTHTKEEKGEEEDRETKRGKAPSKLNAFVGTQGFIQMYSHCCPKYLLVLIRALREAQPRRRRERQCEKKARIYFQEWAHKSVGVDKCRIYMAAPQLWSQRPLIRQLKTTAV